MSWKACARRHSRLSARLSSRLSTTPEHEPTRGFNLDPTQFRRNEEARDCGGAARHQQGHSSWLPKKGCHVGAGSLSCQALSDSQTPAPSSSSQR